MLNHNTMNSDHESVCIAHSNNPHTLYELICFSVTKEVDAGSKEAKDELKKQESDSAKTDTCTDSPPTQSM